jgi:hypothetical protein
MFSRVILMKTRCSIDTLHGKFSFFGQKIRSKSWDHESRMNSFVISDLPSMLIHSFALSWRRRWPWHSSQCERLIGHPIHSLRSHQGNRCQKMSRSRATRESVNGSLGIPINDCIRPFWSPETRKEPRHIKVCLLSGQNFYEFMNVSVAELVEQRCVQGYTRDTIYLHLKHDSRSDTESDPLGIVDLGTTRGI